LDYPSTALGQRHESIPTRRILGVVTSERTQAYGRVLRTLDEVGPTKLHSDEQSRVREAADTLIFAADIDEAGAALADVEALAEHLVAVGRWTQERAAGLVQDLLACGPPLSPVG
jgi:hypothetical protein